MLKKQIREQGDYQILQRFIPSSSKKASIVRVIWAFEEKIKLFIINSNHRYDGKYEAKQEASPTKEAPPASPKGVDQKLFLQQEDIKKSFKTFDQDFETQKLFH